MALSDADVQKQIKHMMAFIGQEAKEKAEEIDAKAEEEFNIEKGRLVQQHRVKIMDVYERKGKQIELQKKIQNSNLQNQARLRVLKHREDHILQVLGEGQTKLEQLATHSRSNYQHLLEGLVTQGLFQLMESDVVVYCRPEDKQLVDLVIVPASKEFESAIKKKIHIKVEPTLTNVSGGVELTAMKGKIKCVNTLESRLKLISNQKLPELRTILFGQNPNRKFLS